VLYNLGNFLHLMLDAQSQTSKDPSVHVI